jgi:hypothetical protein
MRQLAPIYHKHKLTLGLGAIAATFLTIGLVRPEVNNEANGFLGNVLAEAVGIFAGSAITIAVIDRIISRSEQTRSLNNALMRAEGLLLDVAARALWASRSYLPDTIERSSADDSKLESWRAIIAVLADDQGWDASRLSADDPAPAELTLLSPRIWDLMAVPAEKPPSLNVSRRTILLEQCAADFERIANEFIPQIVGDVFEARASAAVITHFVNFLRHDCAKQIASGKQEGFFAHIGGAIWEVLVVFDESYFDIAHPLRDGCEALMSEPDDTLRQACTAQASDAGDVIIETEPP